MAKNPPSPEAVKLRLAGLCARSEQCESDIRTKIFRAGLSSEEADAIIGFLRSNKFIDDGRFASAFARDKSRFAGWGPAKIRRALMMKRLSADVVAEALAEIGEEEREESLMRAARGKARTLDLSDKEDMARLCRHLISKGFSYDDFKMAAGRLRREEME